jgi:hypothetical protein
VHGGDVRRVAADQARRQDPRALELRMRLGVRRRLGESPVQMELLVRRLGLWLLPDPSRSDDNSRRTQEPLEEFARLLRVRVTLDREREAVREIHLSRTLRVRERRDRRAEDGRPRELRSLGRPVRRRFGECGAIVDDDRRLDEDRRALVRVVRKRAPGHERPLVRVAEEQLDELIERDGVCLEGG